MRQCVSQPGTELLQPRRPKQKRLAAVEHHAEGCSLELQLPAELIRDAL